MFLLLCVCFFYFKIQKQSFVLFLQFLSKKLLLSRRRHDLLKTTDNINPNLDFENIGEQRIHKCTPLSYEDEVFLGTLLSNTSTSDDEGEEGGFQVVVVEKQLN